MWNDIINTPNKAADRVGQQPFRYCNSLEKNLLLFLIHYTLDNKGQNQTQTTT